VFSGLWTFVLDEKQIKIKIPILLNLLDSDSKKARHTRATNATQSRLDKDKDKDKDKDSGVAKNKKNKIAKNSEIDDPTMSAPTVRINEIIAFYCDQWKTKYNARPVITGKDAGLISGLVKDIGAARTKELILGYFKHPGAVFAERRHDVGTFKIRLTEIAHYVDTGLFINRRQLQEAEDNQHYAAKNQLDEKTEKEIGDILKSEQPRLAIIGGSND